MDMSPEGLEKLRSILSSSLVRIRTMEEASDLIIDNATDAGYQMGWHAAAVFIAQELLDKNFKAAASIALSVSDLSDMSQS